MGWFERITGIEELEDAAFDSALVTDFERTKAAVAARPIRFSTPTFKEYASEEMEGCSKNSFPAFSITGGGCALMPSTASCLRASR